MREPRPNAPELRRAGIRDVAFGRGVVVAGEVVRLCRLPKDITAHLTDTGMRER